MAIRTNARKSHARKRPFHDAKQLARRWYCSVPTIEKAIREGRLSAVRLSNRGKYLVPTAEIERIEKGREYEVRRGGVKP